MDASCYASDLTDAEWALLEPLVPRSHPAGRRQTYPLRRIVDAIFYLLRTGAQWRLLPHEYPPRCTVFYHYAQGREQRPFGIIEIGGIGTGIHGGAPGSSNSPHPQQRPAPNLW